MAGKIFINYRRGDDPGFTQALLGHLERSFSPDQLFIDVDGIEPGLDFTHVVADQVAKCDVVLAVIGKGWIDARDEKNARRLDNPGDFVRIEIASALEQNKRVIPVLVGNASMPHSDELPDAIKPLALRQAMRLTNDRFRADAEGLIKALHRVLEHAEQQKSEDVAARLEAEDGERAREDSASRQAVGKEAWPGAASVGTEKPSRLTSERKIAVGTLSAIVLLVVVGLAGFFLAGKATIKSDSGELAASRAAAAKPCLLKWVAAKDGMVPDNSIVGGKEAGWDLYVCRTQVDQNILPGKLISGWACYAASNGSEQSSHEYEVLTARNCATDWANAPSGVPAKNSIQGGREAGQPVFICRTNLSVGAGGLHIGRAGWSTNHQCVISYGGKQYSNPVFQTLTTNE